ncbi:MAG TPA: succinate dehydrogenase iron-sulfur subunit [Acidobacteriota bacterium]|nr:succinate dehydrogenase iron-sulfur subunit [Acidobacteriota bacterium]HQP75341.1 succinate dehydrogenase iron-sulfur subunit [Acidobacteriota bacterium]
MCSDPNKVIDVTKAVQDVILRIYRWDSSGTWGEDGRLVDYQVPVPSGMTVLDALIWIKANLDHTLSWRAACRMGVCGSCGMFIHGKPLLACQTQVLKLHADVIEIRPLPNYPIVKDLVTDQSRMIDAHTRIKPYIIRTGTPPEAIAGEFHQTEEELVRYLQFSYCLKCGLCMSACPTVASLQEFPGPQPLGQALRYVYDTRDEGFTERLKEIDNKFGIFRCHFAGACSEACPKGIDPAFAIQLLKKEIVKRAIMGCQAPESAGLMPVQQDDAVKAPNVPATPAFTVEQKK